LASAFGGRAFPREKNNCKKKRVAQFITQTKVWGFLAYKVLINS